MDSKSHLLFAQTLLTKAGKDPFYQIWSIIPDEDLFDGTILHRYRTHRISSIPMLYQKHPELISADKDAVVLAFISHLYADIFNGFIFPFEILNPVWQTPRMFWATITNPIRFTLGQITTTLPSEFYTESETLFNNTNFGTTTERIVYNMISILAKRAGVDTCQGIEPIVQFTGNINYRNQIAVDMNIFEDTYIDLILKYWK